MALIAAPIFFDLRYNINPTRGVTHNITYIQNKKYT